MNNLTSKAGILTAGSAVGQVFLILTTIVLARLLSKGDLGTYKQVFLVNSLLIPIFAAGIPASIFYFLPRFSQEVDKKLFIARTISLLWVIGIGLGIFITLSGFWAPKIMHNAALAPLLIIFGLYAFGSLAASFFEPVMVIYNKLKILLLYPILHALLAFVTVVGIAIFTDGNLKIMIFGISVVSVLFAVVTVLLTKKTLKLEKIFEFNLDNYKDQLAYGIPLGLTSIIGVLAWEFDKLIVSFNFTPELYAVYVIGATEIPFVSLIRTSVSKVILPEMAKVYAEGNLKKFVDLWHASIRKLSLIILPIFVIATVFSHEIITILYSEKFASSVPYFRIYLFLLLIRVASYGIILQAIGKTKENLKGSLVFFSTNAVLNVLLVSWLGLIGPALATVIATFLNVFYYIVVIKKYIKFTWEQVFPWGVVLKNLAVAIMATVVVMPSFYLKLPDLVNVLVFGGLYFLVYLILISILGILTKSDKDLLFSYIQKTFLLVKKQ